MIRLALFFCFFQSSVVMADSLSLLPDPLSLQKAMEMANDPQYYKIIEMQADMATNQSRLEQAESSLGFKAQLEVEAAYIQPSRIALDQSSNDSSVSLRLIKPLYDFGGSDEKILAANIEQLAMQEYMDYIIAQRKIEISRQFFEVILSDLKYAWDNEAMATAYVRFDRAQDRHALSQVSDVELLEAENNYLEIFHGRDLSEMNQRHSRAILAELLNRPSQLPSNLDMPVLDFSKQNLPEYQPLIEKILQNNFQIKLAEKQVEAASQRTLAENRQFYPRLDAEVELSEYARTTGSHDEWRAQINLVVPLYESSAIKTNISKARAEWLKQRSNLLNIKIQVRKQALQLWQKIGVLRKRHQQLQTSQEFRELKLDRSRALYEMEVKTDLGDSMVSISEIQYKQAKNKFELALAWMQLRLLAGEPDIMQAKLL